MATWAIEITVTDLPNKRCRVTGVRTDGEDVRTYSCEGSVDLADLPGTKVKFLTSLQDLHTAAMEKESTVNALLAGWQAALEAAMNAWEVENG